MLHQAPANRSRSTTLLLVPLVASAAFALYALTACPTFYWLDSSEFAAAAATLGISHPPGHPASELLGALLCQLPLGPAAFRVNLASALAAAIAVTAVFLLAHRLLALTRQPHEPPTLVDQTLALAAAALFGLSFATWLQAVRAEVYALESALLVATLVLATGVLATGALATGERRPLLAAGLLLGLGLGNHHLSTILLLLPTLGLALATPSLRRLPLTRSIALGVLGAAILLYLVLRARTGPLVDWGRPDRWSRFFWVVSAKPFQKTALTRARFDLAGVGEAAALLMGELAIVPAFLALLGLAGLFARPGVRRVAIYLVLALGFNVCAVLVTGFDPTNPDAFGYLLPSLAIGAALAAAGVGELVATLSRARPKLMRPIQASAFLLAITVLPVQALHGSPAARLRSARGAEIVAGAELEQIPPRGALLAASFETVFNLWYLQGVEGARPDVEVASRGFALHPGYLGDVGQHTPLLLPIVAAMRAQGARLPLRPLGQLAAIRALFVEVEPPVDLPAGLPGGLSDEASPSPPSTATTAVIDRLLPAGPFFRVPDRSPLPAVRDAAVAETLAFAAHLDQALGPDLTDPETRNALVWQRYVLARIVCAQGRGPAAASLVASARSLAPEDETLMALARDCDR